jgi:hypothetical protein
MTLRRNPMAVCMCSEMHYVCVSIRVLTHLVCTWLLAGVSTIFMDVCMHACVHVTTSLHALSIYVLCAKSCTTIAKFPMHIHAVCVRVRNAYIQANMNTAWFLCLSYVHAWVYPYMYHHACIQKHTHT